MSRLLLVCFLILLFGLRSDTLGAQGSKPTPAGLAWRVQGTWHAAGARSSVLDGDFIQPGSLLLTGDGDSAHSLTILLPDGQRILYECFLPQDCARGFRVPELYRKPEPQAVEMITAVHAVLSRGNRDSQPAHADSTLPRDEAIATLDPQNHVEIAGLASKLPDGRYFYNLRPFDSATPRRSHVPLEKTTSSIKVALPSPGLYDITIADQLNTPRISLVVAAVKSGQAAKDTKAFHDAQALLSAWNEDYQGWPIHDLQRAYLEALILHFNTPVASAASIRETERRASDLTAEPAFSPRPGVFANDTAVVLRCETAGATIHFTVDGSQPFKTSPVYRAPIMVKGTALTIKAFSTAEGKRDSAVVTGIFRIAEQEPK